MSEETRRKMSMPLQFLELSPTKRLRQSETGIKTEDFYQKPYARCINCLQFRTRCHHCLGYVLDSLKAGGDHLRVKLKEPTKRQKPSKIMIGVNEDNYHISNIALKKTQQNAEIMTFQQAVLHKNTILYCMNSSSLPRSKPKDGTVSPCKYRRNLMMNFSYKQEDAQSPRLQQVPFPTEADLRQKESVRRHHAQGLTTTLFNHRKNKQTPLLPNVLSQNSKTRK